MYVLMIDVCVDHALSFARRRACHLKVFTRSHFRGPLFAVHMFTFHSLAVGRCVQRGEEPVMGRRRLRKGKIVTLTFLGHYADSSPFPVLRSSWRPYSDLTRCRGGEMRPRPKLPRETWCQGAHKPGSSDSSSRGDRA